MGWITNIQDTKIGKRKCMSYVSFDVDLTDLGEPDKILNFHMAFYYIPQKNVLNLRDNPNKNFVTFTYYIVIKFI